MKRKIAVLFKDLCCSQCKCGFDEESVQIMREESSMVVFKLTCQKCSKSFGVAFLGISDIELKSDADMESEESYSLQVQDGLMPINIDDVLDAHKFIKDLDEGWKKFVDDNETSKN